MTSGFDLMRNTNIFQGRCLVASIVFSTLASTAMAGTPALTRVEVFPPQIHLHASRARQQFVVQATYADGITREVTAEAKATLVNPATARIDKNTLYPQADGTTQLRVEFGGQTVQVPVQVSAAK